jgi:lipoate-protein ligase B
MSHPLTLHAQWLGHVAYPDAVARQRDLVVERRAGRLPDTLLLLEHPATITLGRGADPRHVLADTAELAHSGVVVYDSDRGGDVTYHGPGQLVAYPILLLPPGRRDTHRYLRDLEQIVIDLAAEMAVDSWRVPGATGVWTARGKLAAIGVRLSTGWITSHGLALNVSNDLRAFEAIVPCGLTDRRVTSLEVETGLSLSPQGVAKRLAELFAARFALAQCASLDGCRAVQRTPTGGPLPAPPAGSAP